MFTTFLTRKQWLKYLNLNKSKLHKCKSNWYHGKLVILTRFVSRSSGKERLIRSWYLQNWSFLHLCCWRVPWIYAFLMCDDHFVVKKKSKSSKNPIPEAQARFSVLLLLWAIKPHVSKDQVHNERIHNVYTGKTVLPASFCLEWILLYNTSCQAKHKTSLKVEWKES